MAASLTARWWRDNQPESADGKALAKALAAYERAPDPRELDKVEAAARETLDALGKKADKAATRALRDLLDLCAAARKKAGEQAEEEEEAEEPADLLDRGQLVKGLKAALSQPAQFAAAEDDTGLHLVVHRSTAASTLGAKLKKKLGATQVTFGVADADPSRPQCLRLKPENKALPSLGKKTKAALKALQPLPFRSCTVVGEAEEEGGETEGSEASVPGGAPPGAVASASPVLARFFGA